MSGKLYLCATPIGNLEDMTFRVVRTLKEVDLIAAEDTRNSIKLLNHFEIKTPMTSYHEYNKIDKGHYLVEQLLEGKNIALVTDAGTPGISDPGEELVAMCYEAGIEVTSLPGPAACITALTLSGLSTRRFAFEAFLPSDKKEKKKILEELKTETRTMIMYEAPHRLLRTLEELFETLGERRLTVCRELFPLCLEPAELVEGRGHELLAAEARLHAHDQHEVQLVEVVAQLFHRGAGLDGHAHLAALGLDGVDGLLDVVVALEVEVEQAGTGLGKSLGVLLGVGDHQVDVIESVRQGLVQALEHRDAKTDVRHEVAVHHVIMQHLRTGIQHHAAVCAKLIEISRKDRRTNDRHCVLYSPLFFRKITPSVLPEHRVHQAAT